MRALRANRTRSTAHKRTDIIPPSLEQGKRFTRGVLDSLELGIPYCLANNHLDIAVPSRAMRIRAHDTASTIYARGIPSRSFVALNNDVAISGPELLFVELADSMDPIEHHLLGHEVCGTFSRDAGDPYNGPGAYFSDPATSTDKIKRFLDCAKSIRGIDAARKTLSLLNDNAWSPTESLCAAFLRLPIDSLGLELGELTLNPRKTSEHILPGSKSSRVPDIVIKGTPVGVNYDGLAHLDLTSIAQAAIELGSHPGVAQTEAALDKALRDVREKALDDIRRNRELAADGLTVFPLLKEDLYWPRGFDQVALQLVELLERTSGRDMKRQRKALRQERLSEERYKKMLSFLPGQHERSVEMKRFIEGHMLYDGPHEVREFWIEL